jgi:hypothetical protein
MRSSPGDRCAITPFVFEKARQLRIAKDGITVQVGRGRPKKLAEVGETSPRSVRFPDEVWRVLEARAKKRGLTLHAALREAILAWIERAA